MAGHSLGEYTALVCAGAIGFADAVKLVRLRAEAMQSAVPEGVGAMAAVLGLDDAAVRAVCAEAAQGEILEAVNFNSPGQVVIAGHKAAVDRGCALAKEKGAKRALPLPVSVPSHCALMQPAAEKLLAALAGIEVKVARRARPAQRGRGRPCRSGRHPRCPGAAALQPGALGRNHSGHGRRGVELIAECGPGKVLAGLNKRIVDGVTGVALADAAAMADTLAKIKA
jgi:[acyl-carrier-protein] S-malonyltransferase